MIIRFGHFIKTNFTVLFACLAFSTIANCADQHTIPFVDLEAARQPYHIVRVPVAAPSAAGILTPATRDHVVTLLSNDNERIVADLIQTRWCFRKTANYTNVIGNTSLYLGSAASAVAAASSLIFPTAVPYILWSGATFFAVHALGIGVAKCSAAQEDVREQQLKSVAQGLGFPVIPVEPVVIDAGATVPSAAVSTTAVPTATTPGVSETDARLLPPPVTLTLHSNTAL